MRRHAGPLQALAASPTMIGAVTVLIAIVAVFLAYNANNGLPFVPVYRVSVEVPNASRLTNNNEVRIGGHRVGVVESIEPVETELLADDRVERPEVASDAANDTGGIAARINLKLDKDAAAAAQGLDLPRSLQVGVRAQVHGDRARHRGPGPRGLRVRRHRRRRDLHAARRRRGRRRAQRDRGDDRERLLPGADRVRRHRQHLRRPDSRELPRATSPATATPSPPAGFSLNQAIENLRPLLVNLKPVSEALIEPATRFRRFFPELGDAARIVAPVAEEQAELFTNMAITFAAISSDPEALKETISEGVPTLETGIETLPRQVPFLRDFTTLARDPAPGRRRPADHAADPERGDRGGHAGAHRLGPVQRGPRGRLRRDARAGRAADDADLAAAPRRHLRHRPAARPLGGARADQLQLLELLVHRSCPTRSRTRTRSATPSARR